MSYTKLACIIFLLLSGLSIPKKGFSQSAIRWEPELSYTWEPFQHWSFNSSLGGRNVWMDEASKELETYDWQFMEGQFFANYEFFNGGELGGGYKYRMIAPFNDEFSGYEHRLMQQYAFVSFVGARRLAHRFRAEQRIRDAGTSSRFRYRLSYDFPTNGQQLDPGETYLIFSEEVLWELNAYENELDNRLYLGIGWYFTDKRKLEAGVQYRLEAINMGSSESIFHIVTSYYLNQ
ncbi:hypothetical protein OKW21_003552 [Catalinimonas alkaloidigena]|uniref:DUF2490 domain-containing protein n=1 Tax=Catalinimonas alkaloidigena TaxID=1075417 RepID=UPI002406A789|nr:DUF2490 domain-containing protein [Catalinimonas alkaloidigena]MDF9798289.1 hypothetical protein [Catalinimonas alkaloidigena]